MEINFKSLEEKLNNLDTSQLNIERLSEEFIKISIKDETITEDLVKLWKFFLVKKTNKLPFIYLANDIIQNSLNRKMSIQDVFFRDILEIFPLLYQNVNDKVKKEIQKLLEIWTERNIFDSEKMSSLKSLLSSKISIFENINNPLFPNLILNKKIIISQKIVDFALCLKKIEKENEIENKVIQEDILLEEEKENSNENYKKNYNINNSLRLNSDNNSRGQILRFSSNAIKKQNQIFFKHVFYLQEIDKMIAKLENNNNDNNNN
jgi:hypothetical protein